MPRKSVSDTPDLAAKDNRKWNMSQIEDQTSLRLERAYASIRHRAGEPCDLALILGSGLGGIANKVDDATVIPYGDIADFPVSTAPGHAGQLVFGTLGNLRVVMMEGRLHLYEGWQARDIALAVRLLRKLGAESLIVTNAAGGLNPDYKATDVMLIEDHINMTGHNPLVGPDDGSIGVRFPDMLNAYDPTLRGHIKRIAKDQVIELHSGIYAGVLGPSLETSAERRYLRSTGADAVGMSTVMEVIAATHSGMRVLGLSAITNMATGGPDQAPDTIEEVLENAAIAGGKIATLIEHALPILSLSKGTD